MLALMMARVALVERQGHVRHLKDKSSVPSERGDSLSRSSLITSNDHASPGIDAGSRKSFKIRAFASASNPNSWLGRDRAS